MFCTLFSLKQRIEKLTFLFYRKKGVDMSLIERLYTILIVINSNYDISIESFKEYCSKTAKLFVDLYPWFQMPCSLHKILIHGHLIINSLDLPIGVYSEEAQECRNKDNKNFRLNHSRKDTRLHTIMDQTHLLLVTSDPVISDNIIKSTNNKKEIKQLPKDALCLIKKTNAAEFEFIKSESSSDESSSSFSSLTSNSSSDEENEIEMSQFDENNNEEIEDFPNHF